MQSRTVARQYAESLVTYLRAITGVKEVVVAGKYLFTARAAQTPQGHHGLISDRFRGYGQVRGITV